MNILVTGGAGYLGSVLNATLLAAGHRVRVLDALLYGDDGLRGLQRHEGFEFIRGDVRSAEDVERAVAGMDAVVHLAAIVGDPACARQPELARAVNLDSSLLLFGAARRAGARRFVFGSTCSNYGRMGDPEAYVDERSELRPVSLYAKTKVQAELELLARAHGGPGPAVTLLRFATLFGVSPRLRLDLTVNQFTFEIATRGRLQVYGERFWRPYVHVRDSAEMVRRILEAPPDLVGGEIFNAGDTRENYRKSQIVDLVCREVGEPAMIEYVEVAEDPRDYRVSFEKLHRILGIRAQRTVSDGIREILDAVRQGAIGDPSDTKYRN